MNRTSFYQVTEVGGVLEVDFTTSTLPLLVFKRPYRLYRVQEQDGARPDLISHKLYGGVGFWWVLCYMNGIQDPLTELKVGMLLKAPDPLDIYEFNKEARVR